MKRKELGVRAIAFKSPEEEKRYREAYKKWLISKSPMVFTRLTRGGKAFKPTS